MATRTRKGFLAALLSAAEAEALTGLTTFTAEEIAPKLKTFVSAEPSPRQLSQSLWYAKRKGFLSSHEREGALSVSLTYKGKERLLGLKRLGTTVKWPKKWDGKWRLVSFDIPEKRRYARDTFRLALKRMGFVKLSSSLWVFPFPCQYELDVVTEALILKPFVRSFVVESFDGDEDVARAFGVVKPP